MEFCENKREGYTQNRMKNQPASSKKSSFIVFGGCEGSGKSTQIDLVKKEYPDAVFFREPGGTEFSEKEMRRLMLTSSYSPDLSPFQHMNLVFAGREDNIRKIVKPGLDAGNVVFADRYDCCSFAYQIFGMQGEASLFSHFDSNRMSMGPLDCLPGLYVIFDISPEEGMKRVAARENAKKGTSNHFDTRGIEFHARVRAGYKRFAEMHSTKVIVIDAGRSIAEVQKDVREVLSRFLKK